MKIIDIKIERLLYFTVLGLMTLWVTSCSTSVENLSTEDLQVDTDYPDLRYSDIEDIYYYPASYDSSNTFQVKSLYHQWEIYSTTGNTWCNISPMTGEAGTLYDVEVYPEDNTILDDRVDTLVLVSEDWVGKTFVIHQKGTAFLNASSEDPTLAEYIGYVGSITVESNQDWTAKIEDGIDWMEIQSGASGNSNGTVSVITTAVNGALRQSGVVYFYDRNGDLIDSVTIHQSGVYMEFTTPENKIPRLGGSVEVAISSNTNVTITIPEEAQGWLSVDQTTISGNGTVTFSAELSDGPSNSTYVLLETDPAMIKDSVLVEQLGAISFTNEYWYSGSSITFNDDGSATLYANPGSGSKNLKSKATDYSYGRYTVYFSDIQIAYTSSTMLMCICSPGNVNGGISWGANANPAYSDGWTSEYWVYDSFGTKARQREDNDILREDIEKYIIDIRKSADEGMVDIDFYINDELLVSTQGIDGFANGDPYCINFWTYNYYDKSNPAVFEPISLLYEPYSY